MRTVDRYLLNQFLRGFAITLISLLGLYVVADFMGNLSEFVDHGKNTGDMWLVVAQYYAARVPWFFDLAGRVVVLLAAVLTIGNLHRHNEFTALTAAGISPARVVKPLIIAGIVISIGAVVNREIGVPRVRDALCRTVKELAGKRPINVTPQYDHATNVLFEGETISYERQQIVKPRLHLPTNWPGVGHNLSAATGTFLPADSNHPAGFLFDGLDPDIGWRSLASYRLQKQPVVITSRDANWIPHANAVFVVSNLTLEQLHRGKHWQQYSSTLQLIAGLHNRSLDYGANTRVLIHSRVVQPLLDVALLLLGLPIALAAERNSVLWAAGKTIVLVIFFTLLVMVGNSLGTHGVLSPALAAWSPLFLIAPLTVLNAGPLWPSV